MVIFGSLIIVRAQIENALSVSTNPINFGTVFPQEYFYNSYGSFKVALSSSFLQEEGINNVHYQIVQKRRCKNFDSGGICLEYYPNLCPYLAKLPYMPMEVVDLGADAPHETEPYPVAIGFLEKANPSNIYGDVYDTWDIILKTPCFEGSCPQDYNPEEFGRPLPSELAGQTFACDLWVEVTDINGIVVTGSNAFSNLIPIKIAKAYEAHIVIVTATIEEESASQNSPPTLSFPESGVYADDGIDPDSGNISTMFTFRVVYADADNDPPAFVSVWIKDENQQIVSGTSTTAWSTRYLDYTSGQELLEGIFVGPLEAGTYSYYFEASDGIRTVRLPRTGGLPLKVWEAKPDLSIKAAPLEFFNDEPSFLPNVLKIRARVINKGNAKAENVVVRFFQDNIQIDSDRNLGPLEIGEEKSTVVKWATSSDIENVTIKAEAISIGQEEKEISDNTITQSVSFYWIDFRHDRDAFSFQNWYYGSFSDFRREFVEFLEAQFKEERYAVFVTTVATPWLFGLLYKDGHCYGMATASVLWHMFPELKPIPKETYQMSLEEAKPDILFYHWQMPLYLLSEGLWELPPNLYNADEEYSELFKSIKNNKRPMVIILSNWPPSVGHAVTGYKILDLGNEKRICVYDNDYPLEYKNSDYCVVFNSSLNEASYNNDYNRVLAVPLEIVREDMTRIISQLIHRKINDWWSKRLMLFRTRSPVAVLLTDEFGRKIGYIDDTFINEIPGAERDQQLDSSLFYLPSDLTYSIKMTGTETGILGLDFVIPISESRAEVIIYENIPVSLGSKVTTVLSATEVPNRVVLESGEIVEPDNADELDASDIVSPAPVNDLITTNPRTDSITLNWTTPGDDWDTGIANTYDIRYSTSAIAEDNWNSATQVIDEPIPQPAGSKETLTVAGLSSDTAYYFAIKTADEIPNWSSLSNIASGTTRIKATVDIDPDTLNLNSKDTWITAYIELPQKYDVNQIEISSVMFNETVPAVGDPKYGFVKDHELTDRDENGLPELVVKFGRQNVREMLEPNEAVKMVITGKIFHNEVYKEFEGSDIIKVID